MGALAYGYESQDSSNLKGSMREVWDGGYFWRGMFTKGADNSLLIVRVVDRLIATDLQMAERRTALNDLAGYYTHVTGEEFPLGQRQRLDKWVSSGYELRDYTILSESALQNNRGRERTIEDAADVPIGNNPCAIIGKRWGPMVISSGNDVQ